MQGPVRRSCVAAGFLEDVEDDRCGVVISLCLCALLAINTSVMSRCSRSSWKHLAAAL